MAAVYPRNAYFPNKRIVRGNGRRETATVLAGLKYTDSPPTTGLWNTQFC